MSYINAGNLNMCFNTSRLVLNKCSNRTLFKRLKTRSLLISHARPKSDEPIPYNTVDPVPLCADVYEPSTGQTGKLPVLILHGLLGSKTNWKSLAKVIAGRGGRKVYALDARNHGDSPHSDNHNYYSMTADVELFTKNNNIERCVLMGHSMGGRTAMVTALQNPDLVERLVVVDVSPLNPKSTDLRSQSSTILDLVAAMKRASQEIVPGRPLTEIRRAVDRRLALDVKDVGLRQFVLTNLIEHEVDGVSKVFWRLNLDVLEASLTSNILHFPPKIQEKSYAGQTLFICGAKSNYLRPEDHSEVEKIFPKCRFEYIPDAGHWVHADKPTEFLKTLMPFL